MKIKDLVISKSKAIAKGAELLAERTNDWQMIKAFLTNRLAEGFSLSPAQEDKKKRYEFAWNQLMSGRYTDMDVVNQLEKTFGIKRSQALIDVEDAKEIYNFLVPLNKAFDIKLQKQMLQVMLQKAQAQNDAKGFAALSREYRAYLEMEPEIEEDMEDMFEGHMNLIMFDPALIGAEDVDVAGILEYINRKRNVKINVSMFQEVEVLDEGK